MSKTEFQEIETLVISMKEDIEKFYDKGVAAAGPRLRKALQAIKTKCTPLKKKTVEQQKNLKK